MPGTRGRDQLPIISQPPGFLAVPSTKNTLIQICTAFPDMVNSISFRFQPKYHLLNVIFTAFSDTSASSLPCQDF